MAVVTSSLAKITFVVTEILFKVAVITSSIYGQHHFCSGLDNF